VASRACLHCKKNDFTVNWVKGSSLKDDVTGRVSKEFLLSNGRTLNDTLKSCNKTTQCSGCRQVEVCGTYNRKQMNLLYVEWSDCRRTRPFERSSRFCCQRLHRSIRSTEDAKIFLVVRRGWQVRINRWLVIEEVREQEAHGDILSEEITSQRLLWDLNARTIHQYCMLTASIPTHRNC